MDVLMSVFKENGWRNSEKPSTTQPWERHLGPRAPHSLLGLPAKWPACVNHHPARRVCTLCSWIHLQGNRATPWIMPPDTWFMYLFIFSERLFPKGFCVSVWRTFFWHNSLKIHLFSGKKKDIINALILKNIFFLYIYTPQAHELDPTKHYLRLKLLIANQVQFYTPKPEEDICDLVCDSPFEHKLIPFYPNSLLKLTKIKKLI